MRVLVFARLEKVLPIEPVLELLAEGLVDLEQDRGEVGEGILQMVATELFAFSFALETDRSGCTGCE